MNPEQEELHKKRDEEIRLQWKRELDEAIKHLRKFTIKPDVAKQLREALKKSCDEYEQLNRGTNELRDEQGKLEHKLKLLKAKIAANDAKLKLIRLIANDQKKAWMDEVYAQTRDPLYDLRSGGERALDHLFGDCFSREGLKIPEMTFEDHNA